MPHLRCTGVTHTHHTLTCFYPAPTGTIGAVGRVADALEPSVAQRVVPWVAQHLATRELGEEDANYLARVLATLAVSANDEVLCDAAGDGGRAVGV